MKILIADDNHDIVETTQMVLELEGHHVVAVFTGSAIFPTAQQERPDLIIQDIRMPGLELEPLLDSLEADPTTAGTKVLLFSGQRPGHTLLEHPLVMGFLGKPFDLADLRRRLAELVER